LLISARKSHAATELATLFAASALCFGLTSTGLLFLASPAHEAALRLFIAPLPAA